MNQAQSPGNGMGRGDAETGSEAASLTSILPEPPSFDAAHPVDFLDIIFGDINSGRIGVTAIGNGPIRNAHFQWAYEAVRQAEAWDNSSQSASTSG